MHPNDQISMLALYPLNPKNSYGARYHIVTTKVVENLPNFLANPKSATLTMPSLFINKFAGFKSRCAIFLLCRYYRPSSICFVICWIRYPVNLYSRSRTKYPKSVSIKSRHKYMMGERWLCLCGFSYNTSFILRMLICSRCCSSLIYLNVVIGNPKLCPYLSSF